MNPFLRMIGTMWTFVVRIAPSGYSRRGTGDNTSQIIGHKSGSRQVVLTSIPGDHPEFSIDPNGMTQSHLAMYGIALVGSYLAANLAGLPQSGGSVFRVR